MSNENPFASFFSEVTLSAIVKNMEKRWGLTLISVLPPDAQARVEQLQQEISKIWGSYGEDSIRRGRLYVEFYQPQQFHCTHLTLIRSDPSGPIRANTFVKKSHNLFELFEIIHRITSQIPQPIKIELDHMKVSRDGHIMILGKCKDECSARYRMALLESLNQALPESFILSRRSWDTDTSKYHKLHCRKSKIHIG